MIAPIKSRNDIHGLLQVTSLQRHAYQEGDLKLVSAVGTQAGIAIENAWLYEDAQRQAQQSAALYDLSQHVNATLNLDSVLDFVAESVVNLLNVDKFALLLSRPKSDRLVASLCRGIDLTEFEDYQPGIGEGIAGGSMSGRRHRLSRISPPTLATVLLRLTGSAWNRCFACQCMWATR